MLNAISVLGWGWALSLIGAFGLAVPFWLFWTAWGLGARYFYWLPEVYHEIPFWHTVGLFIIVSILKTGVPQLAAVSNECG